MAQSLVVQYVQGWPPGILGGPSLPATYPNENQVHWIQFITTNYSLNGPNNVPNVDTSARNFSPYYDGSGSANGTGFLDVPSRVTRDALTTWDADLFLVQDGGLSANVNPATGNRIHIGIIWGGISWGWQTVAVAAPAPAGMDAAVNTPEDTPYHFKSSDFDFSELSGSSATLNAVEITTLPTVVGALTDNSIAVTAGQFVSVSDISGGLLVYTPVTDTWGVPYDSFTFKVKDNGGTTGGRVDTDPNPKTMTINVVNGPSGTNNTETTPEDTPYVFASANFGYSDTSSSPPYTLLAVEITTLPTVGTLTDNGVAVTAGQVVSVSDITNGLLAYAPVANTLGTLYSGFTFQVEDNAVPAGGLVDIDPDPKTMTIDVSNGKYAATELDFRLVV